MRLIKKYGPYAIMAFLTFNFAMAGIFKLTGGEQVSELFLKLGFPVAFAYVIAVSEIAGAIAVWLKPLRFWAALGFIAVCVGIIGSFIGQPDGVNHMPPAFFLGIPAVFLAYISKDDALFLRPSSS